MFECLLLAAVGRRGGQCNEALLSKKEGNKPHNLLKQTTKMQALHELEGNSPSFQKESGQLLTQTNAVLSEP
jgi:hypothetical protein